MKIYPIETEVKIAHGSITATIVQISITKTEIKYEVVYWQGNERKNIWVYEFEITWCKSDKKSLGFHNA